MKKIPNRSLNSPLLRTFADEFDKKSRIHSPYIISSSENSSKNSIKRKTFDDYDDDTDIKNIFNNSSTSIELTRSMTFDSRRRNKKTIKSNKKNQFKPIELMKVNTKIKKKI